MKSIRLVNGHFDGQTESAPAQPQQRLHKRLPHGEWVHSVTGQPVTHDVYSLSVDSADKRIYMCVEQAIEKSTWLQLQQLKAEAQTAAHTAS